MQEKRYNAFNQIHKGLRGMLYDTALLIQQTDFTAPEAAETVSRLEQVLAFFDEHAEHEDKFILPHIIRHNAALVEELEKDHDLDHELTKDLYNHAAAWKGAVTAESRVSLGNLIFYAFNEFIAFNLYHMNKEENVLNYVLWTHYTDAEIHDMEMQIVQQIAPQTLMEESRWMMRSISNTEIIHWLNGVRAGAPEEVFSAYLAMAMEELPASRMAAVEHALFGVAALA